MLYKNARPIWGYDNASIMLLAQIPLQCFAADIALEMHILMDRDAADVALECIYLYTGMQQMLLWKCMYSWTGMPCAWGLWMLPLDTHCSAHRHNKHEQLSSCNLGSAHLEHCASCQPEPCVPGQITIRNGGSLWSTASVVCLVLVNSWGIGCQHQKPDTDGNKCSLF